MYAGALGGLFGAIALIECFVSTVERHVEATTFDVRARSIERVHDAFEFRRTVSEKCLLGPAVGNEEVRRSNQLSQRDARAQFVVSTTGLVGFVERTLPEL